MIKADKAREIATRANHNLFDEQIRTIFECIEDAAEDGQFSFAFTNVDCKSFGLDFAFWFNGAKINDANWQKTDKIFKERGYAITFVVNSMNLFTISIFW